MRALLVQANSLPTYWSYEYSLRFAAKAAALPPLGLATLAALLPARWELRIRDLHLGPLRARRIGKRTVVGGAAATTSPDAFPEADHVFCGEAEGRLDRLVQALESPDVVAPRILSPADERRPDLRTSPAPRFDLLELPRYASLSVQASRGCPFHCEFCDIVEVFGRVPRLKTADQIGGRPAPRRALARAGEIEASRGLHGTSTGSFARCFPGSLRPADSSPDWP